MGEKQVKKTLFWFGINFAMKISDILEIIKSKLNLRTYRELAQFIDKSESTISNWAQRNSISKKNWEFLAQKCGIDINLLFASKATESPIIEERTLTNGQTRQKLDSPAERLKTPQTDFEEMRNDIKLIKSGVVSILDRLDRLLASSLVDEQAKKITALTPEQQKQKRLSKLNENEKTKNKQSP